MLTFLRKIRRSLVDSGNASRYLLYAIGEIALVVIGILIALQINNWNEWRKDQILTQKLYQNLKSSLSQDSASINQARLMTGISLETLRYFIGTPAQKIKSEKSGEELLSMIRVTFNVAYNFYPQMGIYNQIMSGNQMNLIQSDKIKEKLRRYYDYSCNRNRALYALVDDLFHGDFMDFLAKDLDITIFDHFDRLTSPMYTVQELELLRAECRKVYDLTFATNEFLNELFLDSRQLLVLIDEKIK